MADAIRVRNLGKRFRRYHSDRPWTLHEALLGKLLKLRPAETFWGLRDVSFSVAPGRMVGVIGHNGAGKSTLLRLLGGVGRPDEGEIEVAGRVGALLSIGAGFHPDLTGRENVHISGVICGLTRREVAEQFDSIVEFSGLEDYIDSPLRTYSTGMRMRLGFAVASHARPDILLIDEVLAVGDLSFQRKCIERISQFKDEGCTIMLVSHDMTPIRELCDEVLLLRSGRLAAHGPVERVIEEYLSMSAGLSSEPAPDTQSELHGSADRIGSLEVEITSVRMLNSLGTPVTEIDAGEALSIEICFLARQPVATPVFQVYVHREDGVVCFDLGLKTEALNLPTIQGRGQVVLHIEQLNLNQGKYYCDVGIYNHDWSVTYDFHHKAIPFFILPTGVKDGIIRPPHHWKVRCEQGFRTSVPAIKVK
ncbi:MAG TPA: ABC transporter ATP-binding protein [Blastocatellia bacterium]|nr:ABC transporter ATP-binding protein [Blastocatellia bacterium]